MSIRKPDPDSMVREPSSLAACAVLEAVLEARGPVPAVMVEVALVFILLCVENVW
jgi:hypothetical protein